MSSPQVRTGCAARRERLEDVRTVAEAWARLELGQPAGLAVLVNGRLADWRTDSGMAMCSGYSGRLAAANQDGEDA